MASKVDKLTILISENHTGDRLDTALGLLSGLTRTQIQRLISDGLVVKNSGEVQQKLSAKVQCGDIYTINVPAPTALNIATWDFPLDILYEDTDIIVINKPHGMTVHPGSGNYDHTLVNALLYHCKNLSGIGGVMRPGIVHRLDKDTSGILVVAKNDKAHLGLSQQFESRNCALKKIYTCLCVKTPMLLIGTIENYIARHTVNRKKMAIYENKGKYAKTAYEVKNIYNLNNKTTASEIQCHIFTGRTHQIRLHMHHLGCPIIGDNTYGARKKTNIDFIDDFPRQALHASQLSFEHPTTSKLMHFHAPLPKDMFIVQENLKKYSLT